MKILQVTQFFSPVHGGSAEVPYQLSKELAKRGHEVAVYTSDFKLSHDYIDSIPKVRVRFFKTWSSWANFYVCGTRRGRKNIRLDCIKSYKIEFSERFCWGRWSSYETKI